MLAVCASSIRNVLMDTPSSKVSTRTCEQNTTSF
jgi:hypothetical protein